MGGPAPVSLRSLTGTSVGSAERWLVVSRQPATATAAWSAAKKSRSRTSRREINRARDDARARGLKALAPQAQRALAARYDALVAQGQAANPDPPAGRERDYDQRKQVLQPCHRLCHPPQVHPPLHLDLQTPMTNNDGQRNLRPTNLHRKISGLFPTSTAPSASPTHAATYPPPARTASQPPPPSPTCPTASPGCPHYRSQAEHSPPR